MVPKWALDLRRSRTQVPLRLVKCSASVDAIDLVLEIGWVNECVALAVQVVNCHRGCLSRGLLIIHTHGVKSKISKGLEEGRDSGGPHT